MNLEEASGRTQYRSVELDVQLYTDPTDTFTVAVVSGARYTGVGVAKRCATDPVNHQIGYDVACARALRELASQTERGANSV